VRSVESLVAERRQLEGLFQGDPVSPVESLVSERKQLEILLGLNPVNTAASLVAEHKRLEELLQGDPVSLVEALVSERQRLDALLDSDPIGAIERIAALFPFDSGSLEDKIRKLVADERDIRSTLPGSDRLPASVSFVVARKNQLEELVEQLSNDVGAVSDTLAGRVDELLSELARLRQLVAEVRETLGCESDPETLVMICRLKDNLKLGKDLFEGLIELMNGSHIEVDFPLSDEKRTLLLVGIRELRVKLEETHTAKSQVIARAMEIGYIGTDLPQAVEELERAAAQREREKAAGHLAEIKMSCEEERKLLIRHVQEAERKNVKLNGMHDALRTEHRQLAKQLADANFEAERRIRELQTQIEALEAVKVA
jgi:hypothetical protein